MKATEVGWAGHKTRGIKKDVQVNKQVLGCCEKKKSAVLCHCHRSASTIRIPPFNTTLQDMFQPIITLGSL